MSPSLDSARITVDVAGLPEVKAYIADLLARAEAAEEALREIAALTDGQEGRSAQTMMMHGFSPVKALGRARDIARRTLEQGDKDE